jgi:hypothetical protein
MSYELEKIYANLTQCVINNQDKENPQKYCLKLLARTDKQLPPYKTKK